MRSRVVDRWIHAIGCPGQDSRRSGGVEISATLTPAIAHLGVRMASVPRFAFVGGKDLPPALAAHPPRYGANMESPVTVTRSALTATQADQSWRGFTGWAPYLSQ